MTVPRSPSRLPAIFVPLSGAAETTRPLNAALSSWPAVACWCPTPSSPRRVLAELVPLLGDAARARGDGCGGAGVRTRRRRRAGWPGWCWTWSAHPWGRPRERLAGPHVGATVLFAPPEERHFGAIVLFAASQDGTSEPRVRGERRHDVDRPRRAGASRRHRRRRDERDRADPARPRRRRGLRVKREGLSGRAGVARARRPGRSGARREPARRRHRRRLHRYPRDEPELDEASGAAACRSCSGPGRWPRSAPRRGARRGRHARQDDDHVDADRDPAEAGLHRASWSAATSTTSGPVPSGRGASGSSSRPTRATAPISSLPVTARS